MGVAYVKGFQGEEMGPHSVATMIKHFPGGGPQKDGEDPHFAYGREQVYPGGQFELHLKPFEVALEAGVSQVMPYYGMPVGTEWEEVGFGFNKGIVTDLLRKKLGFDGIVCTDWGLISNTAYFGQEAPVHAWGVEHLTRPERMKKILDAGVDQFGGESCPDVLLELVRSGEVTEERLNVSARRLLREKFVLGLFENPYIDADAANAVVGSPAAREAGEQAQRASITVLTNGGSLPFAKGAKLYVEGVKPEVAAQCGEVVDSPAEVDLAILRIKVPFEVRETMFENMFHAGSLDFPQETLDHVAEVGAQVPTVVDVFLDRPAILAPVVDSVDAITANWGASDGALLDVLSGVVPARGKLPFDVPRSMAAVEASDPDVPFDTKDPIFRFGHGLSL